MSETKHTPLPWEVVYVHGWPLGIGRRMRDGVLNAFRMIGNTMGRRTKEKDKATCEANAQLIVTSVNARPKVEKALRVGEQVDWDGILARLNCVGMSEHYMKQLRQLRLRLRDGEAALKGEV